jgi:hypothetical protein
VHRDAFGEGPEVDLCDECGSNPTEPTLETIWERIGEHPERHAAGFGWYS